MEDKKTYSIPKMEIINFDDNDIITYSSNEDPGNNWSEYKDIETW